MEEEKSLSLASGMDLTDRLRTVVLNRGSFAPQGTLAMSGGVFGCYNWVGRGATGISWAEARDVANILQGIG